MAAILVIAKEVQMRPTMHLISALVTAATLAYGSALLHAEAQVPVARVIAADEGLVHTGSIGATIHFKIGSLSTGANQVFLATGLVPPGVETPVHLHEVDEEVLYVLEGEITLKLNDTVHKVSAGGIAFIPPGTWMQVANKSAVPARIIGILSRGEVERCFRAIYAPPGEETSERSDDIATCRMKYADTHQQH